MASKRVWKTWDLHLSERRCGLFTSWGPYLLGFRVWGSYGCLVPHLSTYWRRVIYTFVAELTSNRIVITAAKNLILSCHRHTRYSSLVLTEYRNFSVKKNVPCYIVDINRLAQVTWTSSDCRWIDCRYCYQWLTVERPTTKQGRGEVLWKRGCFDGDSFNGIHRRQH